MAVLMIADVANLTEELYSSMIGQMTPLLKAADGFISHTGGPGPDGGWRIVEVWETEEDGANWFEATVRPTLPPDITPDRQYFPLRAVITK